MTIKFVLWRIYEIDHIFSLFFVRCSIVRKLFENHLRENGIFILLDIELNLKKEKNKKERKIHIFIFYFEFIFLIILFVISYFNIHFYE